MGPGRICALGGHLDGNRSPPVLPPGNLGGRQGRQSMGLPAERGYFLVQMIGQGTQASQTGRGARIGRARPSLPGRPGRTGVNAWKERLSQKHRRPGWQQGRRTLPGVSGGPFGGFRCLCLLAEPFYRPLGGLPPLRGQGTVPPAYRAVAVAVRIMVLQRGGQQSGQRSRLASGRARDGV